MKKGSKIAIIVFTFLLIVGYGIFRVLYGPSVNMRDKREIKKYVEQYLNQKYGDHKFKVTDVRYEYNMETLFDYSDPTGYWVDFKSDVASDSYAIIDGLEPNEYKVSVDNLIRSYYFPDKTGYDVYEIMESMKPKAKLDQILLDALRNNFDPNAYEVNCDIIELSVPEDYGKIPTLEEIKTNTSLYKVLDFDYKVSIAVKDTNDYAKGLKEFISNMYDCSSEIYFYSDNTLVSVSLDY